MDRQGTGASQERVAPKEHKVEGALQEIEAHQVSLVHVDLVDNLVHLDSRVNKDQEDLQDLMVHLDQVDHLETGVTEAGQAPMDQLDPVDHWVLRVVLEGQVHLVNQEIGGREDLQALQEELEMLDLQEIVVSLDPLGRQGPLVG